MTKCAMFGWSLLILGLASEAVVLAYMIWVLSDMGYHIGAAAVTIIVGLFLFDQVHDYEDLQED